MKSVTVNTPFPSIDPKPLIMILKKALTFILPRKRATAVKIFDFCSLYRYLILYGRYCFIITE
jgi:hypothetical protein